MSTIVSIFSSLYLATDSPFPLTLPYLNPRIYVFLCPAVLSMSMAYYATTHKYHIQPHFIVLLNYLLSYLKEIE